MTNKTVLIIGGSGKLGQNLVIQYLEKDYTVICTYRDRKEVLKKDIKSNKLYFYFLDVTDTKSIDIFCKVIFNKFKKINYLIINASINNSKVLRKENINNWDKIIKVNLTGNFFCAKVFGERMKKILNSSILFVSSTAGIKPVNKSYPYLASKAAILNLTRAFALELAPNTRVNAIAIGYFKGAREINEIALKRFASYVETSRFIYLLSVEINYITGQTIIYDGGLTL